MAQIIVVINKFELCELIFLSQKIKNLLIIFLILGTLFEGNSSPEDFMLKIINYLLKVCINRVLSI